MTILEIKNLSLKRGDNQVLNQLSLELEENEILGLIGPSGCGKTSLLYALAGLLPVESGEILWQGKDLSPLPVHKRNFGLVFQDHLLFPHKSVEENIAFGLKMSVQQKSGKTGRSEIKKRTGELLQLLELEGMEKRRIQSLSGGQAQRVSLGRTLAPKPRLLILDEPLAALDQTLRDTLSQEIRQIIKSQKIPAIYVTHDLREVFMTTDRLALMKDGKIHQTGIHSEIRNNPGDSYTASFFGLDNQFEVELTPENILRCPWGDMPLTDEKLNEFLTANPKLKKSSKQTILILPEDITISDSNTSGDLNARVMDSRFLGTDYLLTVKLEESGVLLTTMHKTHIKPAQTLQVMLNTATFKHLIP